MGSCKCRIGFGACRATLSIGPSGIRCASELFTRATNWLRPRRQAFSDNGLYRRCVCPARASRPRRAEIAHRINPQTSGTAKPYVDSCWRHSVPRLYAQFRLCAALPPRAFHVHSGSESKWSGAADLVRIWSECWQFEGNSGPTPVQRLLQVTAGKMHDCNANTTPLTYGKNRFES